MFFFFQFHLPLGIFPRNYLWAKDGVKTLGGHRTRWSLMLSLPGPDPPPFWASIMTTFSSFCHGSFFVVSTFKTNCRCKEMWGSQHSLPFNLEKERKPDATLDWASLLVLPVGFDCLQRKSQTKEEVEFISVNSIFQRERTQSPLRETASLLLQSENLCKQPLG